MVQTSVPEYAIPPIQNDRQPLTCDRRLYEDDTNSAIDIRTDSLQGLRELGPPDLVSLIKQASKTKQVRLEN